jgi:hypothetical protein
VRVTRSSCGFSSREASARTVVVSAVGSLSRTNSIVARTGDRARSGCRERNRLNPSTRIRPDSSGRGGPLHASGMPRLCHAGASLSTCEGVTADAVERSADIMFDRRGGSWTLVDRPSLVLCQSVARWTDCQRFARCLCMVDRAVGRFFLHHRPPDARDGSLRECDGSVTPPVVASATTGLHGMARLSLIEVLCRHP